MKYDNIGYSPFEISTINTATVQIYIKRPREVSVISSFNSFLDLNFDVLHAATNKRYVNDGNIGLGNLEPIALFNINIITTSTGKQIEDINHAHTFSLLTKLSTSSRSSDDLSFGFHRDRNRRHRELTNNKNQKGKNHIRNYLKGVSGSSEHQERTTFGLGFKSKLTRNFVKSVLKKANATDIGKFKVNSIEWYIPHYIASIPQQAILYKQILSKLPKELQYVEISIVLREVNT